MANCQHNDRNKDKKCAGWKKSKDDSKTTLLADAGYVFTTNDTKTTSTTIETTSTNIKIANATIKTASAATLSWIVDSSCTNHMTGEKSAFKTFTLVRL